MDLDLTPTPTKSGEDTEIDTPPRTHVQSLNGADHLYHFINDTYKNHNHLAPPPMVTYKECMKNHAAAIGGHAVDGCGEFMTSPSTTPADPTSLSCAACGCHRNFHRRDLDFSTTTTTTTITPPFLDFRRPLISPSPPPHTIQFGPHTLLTLNTAIAEQDHHQAPVTPSAENPVCRKRFRTKFTQIQKEKMHSFSERLGWKMQKCDEVLVEEFCKEVGVTKGVLKVWMHNNKNTLCKKDSSTTINVNGGMIISLENNGGSTKIERGKSDNESLFHRSNNGSTSSSSDVMHSN